MKIYNLYWSKNKKFNHAIYLTIEEITEIIKLEIENTKEIEIIIKEIGEEKENVYKKSK